MRRTALGFSEWLAADGSYGGVDDAVRTEWRGEKYG